MLKPNAVVTVTIEATELKDEWIVFGTYPITFTVAYFAGKPATQWAQEDPDEMEIVKAIDAFGNDYTSQYDLGYFMDSQPDLYLFLLNKFWQAIEPQLAADAADYVNWVKVDSQRDDPRDGGKQ